MLGCLGDDFLLGFGVFDDAFEFEKVAQRELQLKATNWQANLLNSIIRFEITVFIFIETANEANAAELLSRRGM